MEEPRPVQKLADMARDEALMIVGVVIKLAFALCAVEGLTWAIAAAPMPAPPAAPGLALRDGAVVTQQSVRAPQHGAATATR